MRISAYVPFVVVAQKQRARHERHEPADLFLDQRHRVWDAQARPEGLRDFVERLLLAMRTGDVLQREPFIVGPRDLAGDLLRQRR